MKIFCYVQGRISTLDSLQHLYNTYVAEWVYDTDPKLENVLSVLMCCGGQRHPPPRGDFWTCELALLLSSWLSGASSSLLFWYMLIETAEVLICCFRIIPLALVWHPHCSVFPKPPHLLFKDIHDSLRLFCTRNIAVFSGTFKLFYYTMQNWRFLHATSSCFFLLLIP